MRAVHEDFQNLCKANSNLPAARSGEHAIRHYVETHWGSAAGTVHNTVLYQKEYRRLVIDASLDAWVLTPRQWRMLEGLNPVLLVGRSNPGDTAALTTGFP